MTGHQYRWRSLHNFTCFKLLITVVLHTSVFCTPTVCSLLWGCFLSCCFRFYCVLSLYHVSHEIRAFVRCHVKFKKQILNQCVNEKETFLQRAENFTRFKHIIYLVLTIFWTAIWRSSFWGLFLSLDCLFYQSLVNVPPVPWALRVCSVSLQMQRKSWVDAWMWRIFTETSKEKKEPIWKKKYVCCSCTGSVK